MRVTVFDYGAGNLHSLVKALATPDTEVRIEPDPRHALDTDLLVLPGVGAFQAAAARLAPALGEVREALAGGLPCLGICLGMQLLFDRSEEGPGEGLGVIAGDVTRVRARRVPHIGWNAIEDVRDAVFDDAPLALAYFANGFACRPESDECVVAWTTHECDRFAAAVRKGSIVGVQFHPEKSSGAGVEFLRAAVESVRSEVRRVRS
jgi:imidazole glycerol-phosphate synthase subunit HisH